MNTIDIHKKGSVVEAVIRRNFNYRIRKMIEGRVGRDTKKLKLDLGRTKIIDSEAVIFLYKWLRDGKSLELVEPPDILFEILDLLEIRKEWDTLYESKNNRNR